jgi:hypothetical protein
MKQFKRMVSEQERDEKSRFTGIKTLFERSFHCKVTALACERERRQSVF